MFETFCKSLVFSMVAALSFSMPVRVPWVSGIVTATGSSVVWVGRGSAGVSGRIGTVPLPISPIVIVGGALGGRATKHERY